MKKFIIVVVVIVAAGAGYFALTGKEVPTDMARDLVDKVSPETSNKIASLTGPATIARADGTTSSATVGAEINAGDKVSTSGSARCAVELEDGSTASLGPNTEFGVGKIGKKLAGRVMDIELTLDVGKILVDVPRGPMQRTSMRIVTPSASLGVRGTNFCAVVDDKKATRVGVFEGVVEVTAQDTTVSLSAEQTTMAEMGAAPAEPERMLAAPALSAPEDQQVIRTEKVQVRFAAVEGAKGYLVEMAQNGKFTHVVAEATGEGTSIDVALPKDYRLWIRVSALNALGLQGKPSEVHTVSYVFHQGGAE